MSTTRFFPEYDFSETYSDYLVACIQSAIYFLETDPQVTRLDLTEIAKEVGQLPGRALEFSKSCPCQEVDIRACVTEFNGIVSELVEHYEMYACEIPESF